MGAIDLCGAPLAHSFSQDTWLLLPRVIVGVAGAWGLGLGFELWFSRRSVAFSASHALIQGSVATSVLLLLASLAGVPVGAAAWPVASLGLAMGGLAGYSRWRSRASRATLTRPARGERWIVRGLIFAAFPVAFMLCASPMVFNDLTAIWTFHAKALVCEPLLDARFVTEPFFTGTHPEYPLHLPLLHAHFFSLMGAFRDDLVRIWQAVAFLAVLVLAYRELYRLTARRLPGLVAAAFVVTLAVHNPDGKVELTAALLAATLTMAFLRGELARVPLYLAGLAFTKNESTVAALLLLGCAALMVLFRREGVATLRGRRNRYLLVAGGAVLATFAVLALLPSRHEQYPRRLTSLEAWRSGLEHGAYILGQCAELLAKGRWSTAFVAGGALLVALGVRAVARQVRRSAPLANDERTLHERAAVLLLWVLGMLAVFWAIYVVSPWGRDLYRITLERLVLPLVPPLSLVVIALVGHRAAAPAGAARHGARALLLGLLALYVYQSSSFYAHLVVQPRWRGGRGVAAYRDDPRWQRALALDALLPPAARVALLRERDYFQLNFMLYPRVLYSAAPDEVAGTWRDWKNWTLPAQVDASRWRLDWFVDAGRADSVTHVSAPISGEEEGRSPPRTPWR